MVTRHKCWHYAGINEQGKVYTMTLITQRTEQSEILDKHNSRHTRFTNNLTVSTVELSWEDTAPQIWNSWCTRNTLGLSCILFSAQPSTPHRKNLPSSPQGVLYQPPLSALCTMYNMFRWPEVLVPITARYSATALTFSDRMHREGSPRIWSAAFASPLHSQQSPLVSGMSSILHQEWCFSFGILDLPSSQTSSCDSPGPDLYTWIQVHITQSRC